MSDPGADFVPREKREARRFEPPPWERAQFDEMARQKEEQQVEARSLEAEGESSAEAAAPPGAATGGPEAAEPPAREGGPDPAELTEMLAGLASEEPSATGTIWKASVAIGAATVGIGVLFLVWGIIALVGATRSGAVGFFGGSVVLLFGAGLVAGGVYVVAKNLRQQGVL